MAENPQAAEIHAISTVKGPHCQSQLILIQMPCFDHQCFASLAADDMDWLEQAHETQTLWTQQTCVVVGVATICWERCLICFYSSVLTSQQKRSHGFVFVARYLACS